LRRYKGTFDRTSGFLQPRDVRAPVLASPRARESPRIQISALSVPFAVQALRTRFPELLPVGAGRGAMGKSIVTITKQVLVVMLALPHLSAEAFLTPAIWSRIQGHFRFFGRQPGTSLDSHQSGQPQGAWGARTSYTGSFGDRLFGGGDRLQRSRLQATAPISFGDFGGEEFNINDMRDQMKALEAQLASAMNIGEWTF
jgi:hypothetical protein